MSFNIVMVAMRTHSPPFSTLRAATLAAVALCLLAAPARARAAQQPSDDEIRRVLTLLAAVGEEYREGLRDGTVVRPIEFEEARAFFDDARQRFTALSNHLPAAAAEIAPLFDEIGSAIDNKAALDNVVERLGTLRQRIAVVGRVSEQVYPEAPPSAARGHALFDQYCATCHGDRGDGKGPSAAQLNPPPADFTNAQFVRGETPYDFYHVISLGKRSTAMAAWDDVLSVQDRWDLVSYLWTLAPGPNGIAEGQGIYLTQCASCHGARGNGHGALAHPLTESAPDLSQPQALAHRTDTDLFAATTDGIAGTPMPSFARALREDERWKAVAFLRALSLGGPEMPPDATRGDGSERHTPLAAGAEVISADPSLTESARLLEAALAAYARGDSAATSLASEAYLEFEPIEPRLGATNPGLKTQIEERFLHLRQALRTSGNDSEVTHLAAAVHEGFAAARTALQPHASPYALFLESAGIILREGFEIVLVIGALIAYVAKTGNAAMRRAIYAGTTVGVAASLATALILGEVLQSYPGSSEMLEGVTMLLAAGVLFWVSYWLISKTEADRWQRYIRTKVQNAVTSRRGLALASAAFLAVYREGFETVLFYQALYASAPAASLTLISGLVTGSIALLVVYALFRYFEVRIPIQQFFFVTGLFLYAMAAIFAGQGVHELQEIALIATTPVAWLPAIPLLGLYPSAQSLAAQGVFVALLVYATLITLRRRRASRATALGTAGAAGAAPRQRRRAA